ncbi:MAG: TRAP transporter small permease [Candidatus Hydrogenedentales bacterium]|jgi:TRAP-type C4-dicarboxylate transport system permease small subunit
MNAVFDMPLVRAFFRIRDIFWLGVRYTVMAFAAIAGLAALAMALVICIDIVARWLHHPFPGAYDIVRFLGTLVIAGALPYTTAVKGHVAVEFFFQKMHRLGRVVVDSLSRLIVMILFSTFSWQCVRHGLSLKAAREISPTLGLPMFWLSFIIAAACVLTTLVLLYKILHPGREMIKP